MSEVVLEVLGPGGFALLLDEALHAGREVPFPEPMSHIGMGEQRHLPAQHEEGERQELFALVVLERALLITDQYAFCLLDCDLTKLLTQFAKKV